MKNVLNFILYRTRKEDHVDSDFFLIRKMRQGDEEAFDIFIRKYYGDILRYCACHCFDAEDAQDLMQETFVRFFSRFSDYRHKGKTKNYLYTIAGNLCKNYYKKNKAPAADDVYGESGDTTESLEDSVIERAALEWALDYLEPELRDVIDLYYFRELKLREMAETLFAILIIPELWKNRANCCMEIEGSTYYALRQIYSARILLFGLADILLFTLFCCMAAVSLRTSLTELLTQFIFPMIVTACICFGIFGSRNQVNESTALGLCTLWSALWWCILMDEKLYRAISVPVWMILLGMVLLFLIIAVYRSIRQCDDIWEVNADGTENE